MQVSQEAHEHAHCLHSSIKLDPPLKRVPEPWLLARCRKYWECQSPCPHSDHCVFSLTEKSPTHSLLPWVGVKTARVLHYRPLTTYCTHSRGDSHARTLWLILSGTQKQAAAKIGLTSRRSAQTSRRSQLLRNVHWTCRSRRVMGHCQL